MNNLTFGIIITVIISFLIYYMTAPFASQNNLIKQPNKDEEYVQRLTEQSKTINEIQEKEQEQKKPFVSEQKTEEFDFIEPESKEIKIQYTENKTYTNNDLNEEKYSNNLNKVTEENIRLQEANEYKKNKEAEQEKLEIKRRQQIQEAKEYEHQEKIRIERDQARLRWETEIFRLRNGSK